jgi:tetratricopeptide (TPR) repeat protein
MSASPIQFSLPFCRGKSSEEKVDCSYYAKIAAFAIGKILLVAGILALSGAFGSLGGEIGWTLAALGAVGLAISCVRCANKKDDLSNANNYQFTPIVPPSRNDPLSPGPTWQDDNTFSQRSYSNPFSVNRIGSSSHSSFKQKNTQSDNPHFKQAETYFEQGDLAAALKEIKKIYGEDEVTEPFIARLASAYATTGNKEQAFKTIKEISHNSEIKEAFLAKLAQAYFNEKTESGVLQIIEEVVKKSLIHKLLESGHRDKCFEIMKRTRTIGNSRLKDFFVQLAQECYSEVKVHFEQDKSTIAIAHSKNKAVSSKYLQEFLKF